MYRCSKLPPCKFVISYFEPTKVGMKSQARECLQTLTHAGVMHMKVIEVASAAVAVAEAAASALSKCRPRVGMQGIQMLVDRK